VRLEDGDIALRPLAEEDVPAIVEACRDPEIPRRTSVPEGLTARQAEEFVAEAGDVYAIVDADTDELLGTIGFHIPEHGRGNFGYWVRKEARGRGVATRALVLLCRWAARERGLGRLQLIVEPDNLASIRVAERAGFRREGRLRDYIELKGSRRDVYMYSLLPEELR
jgi:RimJ/RimL family protein N-acetyltransferase